MESSRKVVGIGRGLTSVQQIFYGLDWLSCERLIQAVMIHHCLVFYYKCLTYHTFVERMTVALHLFIYYVAVR